MDEEGERERRVAGDPERRRRSPPPSARTCRGSPGPDGIAVASATPPAASSAAWPTVSSMPSAWPAGGERHDRAAQATTLKASAAAIVRGRAATRGRRAAVAASSHDRGQRSRNAATRSAPGRRWSGQRDRRGRRRAAPARAEPEQDRAGHHPADVQDEDRDRGDGHQDHRVHDPLDDDRAQVGAALIALAVAEVVAPDQLAEAGRQDVVGEVADEHVAADAAVAGRAGSARAGAASGAPGRPGRTMHADDRGQAEHGGRAGRRQQLAVGRRIDDAQDDEEIACRARDDGCRAPLAARSASAGAQSPGAGARRQLPRPPQPDAVQQEAQRRLAASTGRRRRCAGSRPSWPPRSSASARRSRRSRIRQPRPGRRAPGRRRSRRC